MERNQIICVNWELKVHIFIISFNNLIMKISYFFLEKFNKQIQQMNNDLYNI